MSEYGCNKGERKFEEVASLYGDQMTPVYSGGLVYEYTEEPSKYGLVDLSDPSASSVDERPDFDALQAALAGTTPPSGDGGYKSNGKPSTCPPQSDTWDVDTTELPAIPSPAVAYMQNGPGKGFGLDGAGSQNAGTPSTGFKGGEDSGSQAASGASASPSSGAGAAVAPTSGTTPFVCAVAMLLSVSVGFATLL
ncbi:MAG: hypothetical protein INR71_05305 [Terriglobus roseus]|nr:hypothetical protein [Terriglobus roseus]